MLVWAGGSRGNERGQQRECVIETINEIRGLHAGKQGRREAPGTQLWR